MSKKTSKEEQKAIILFKMLAQISNSSKFTKILILVKFLLQASNLEIEYHGRLMFEALKTSTFKKETMHNLSIRESFRGLFESARQSYIFTTRQKSQMDIFASFFAAVDQVMSVEDSFMFSRLLAKMKFEIDNLPDVLPMEKIKYNDMLRNVRHNLLEIGLTIEIRFDSLDNNQLINDEIDKIKFYPGLFFIFEFQTIYIEKAYKTKCYDGTLDDNQMIALKRELMIEFLESLKMIYIKNWAKSSIEIVWEYSKIQMKKFLPGLQQKRLEDLNLQNKQIDGLKEYSTKKRKFENSSYENKEKEWSQQKVSRRCKIESKADTKSTTWLG